MAMTREYLDLVENAIDIAPVGSQEEVQAAEFILSDFEEHGLQTELQDLSAPLYGRAVTGIFLILSFVAALLSGLGGIGMAVIGFVVALFVFAYLASQYMGSNPIADIGPQAQSQNVIGVHKGEGAHAGRGVRPIVVMARYDTGREELLARPGLATIAPTLWRGAPWFLIVVAVCTLLELFQFMPAGVLIGFWIVGMVASVPLVVLGVNEIAAPFQNLTDGANDNKAALAALFGVLEDVVPTNAEQIRLRAARLAHAEYEEVPPEVKEHEVIETRTVMREEPVVGVRHGKAVLEAIGMLPATCEIVYQKPKQVPVVEERRVWVRDEPEPEPEPEASYEEPYQEPYEEPYQEPYEEPYEPSYEEPNEESYEEPYEGSYEEPYEEGEPEFIDEGEEDEFVEEPAFEFEEEELRQRAPEAFETEQSEPRDQEVVEVREVQWQEPELHPEPQNGAQPKAQEPVEAQIVYEQVQEEPRRVSRPRRAAAMRATTERLGNERPEPGRPTPTTRRVHAGRVGGAPNQGEIVGRNGRDLESTNEMDFGSFEDTNDLGATGEVAFGDSRALVRSSSQRITVSDPNATGSLSQTGELGRASATDPDATNSLSRGSMSERRYVYVGEGAVDMSEREATAALGETHSFDMSSIEPLPTQEGAPEAPPRRAVRAPRVPRTGREYLRSVPSTLEEVSQDRDGALRRSVLVDLPDPTQEKRDPLSPDEPQGPGRGSGDLNLVYSEEAPRLDHPEGQELDWERDEAVEADLEADFDSGAKAEGGFLSRHKRDLANRLHRLPHISLKRKKAAQFEEEIDEDNAGDTAEQEALLEGSTHRKIRDRLSFLRRRGQRNSLDEWVEDDEELLDDDEDDWIGGATRSSGQRGPLRLVSDDPDHTVEMSTPASFDGEFIVSEVEPFDGHPGEFAQTSQHAIPSGEVIYASQAGSHGKDEEQLVEEPLDDTGSQAVEGASDDSEEPGDELTDAVLAMGDVDLVAHDIWFVCVGASSLGHAGTKAFVEAHRRELRGCFLINLDSIGAGELTLITNEGYGDTRRGDRKMGKLIENAAKKLRVGITHAAHDWEDTDVTPALRRSMRGLTIMGTMGGKMRALAQTPEDVQENLNPNLVVYTNRLVSEAIRHS